MVAFDSWDVFLKSLHNLRLIIPWSGGRWWGRHPQNTDTCNRVIFLALLMLCIISVAYNISQSHLISCQHGISYYVWPHFYSIVTDFQEFSAPMLAHPDILKAIIKISIITVNFKIITQILPQSLKKFYKQHEFT